MQNRHFSLICLGKLKVKREILRFFRQKFRVNHSKIAIFWEYVTNILYFATNILHLPLLRPFLFIFAISESEFLRFKAVFAFIDLFLQPDIWENDYSMIEFANRSRNAEIRKILLLFLEKRVNFPPNLSLFTAYKPSNSHFSQ